MRSTRRKRTKASSTVDIFLRRNLWSGPICLHSIAAKEPSQNLTEDRKEQRTSCWRIPSQRFESTNCGSSEKKNFKLTLIHTQFSLSHLFNVNWVRERHRSDVPVNLNEHKQKHYDDFWCVQACHTVKVVLIIFHQLPKIFPNIKHVQPSFCSSKPCKNSVDFWAVPELLKDSGGYDQEENQRWKNKEYCVGNRCHCNLFFLQAIVDRCLSSQLEFFIKVPVDANVA